MVAFRIAAASFAAFVAVAAAGKGYGYYETKPTCTATGDKCAGAEGYPYVKYAPCCDETKECIIDPSLGWGRFCVTKPSYYGEEKCYKTGHKCAGAPGKPYVEYHPCCKLEESCVEDKEMGWGSFCKAPAGYYSAPEEPKCYKTGDRCMGAPGKPYVTYLPCCKYGDECVEDSYMGWGSFCKPSKSKPKTPKSYYYKKTHTEAPPVVEDPPMKYGYGKADAMPKPTPTPTPTPTPAPMPTEEPTEDEREDPIFEFGR